jgi:hypothetical protein
MSRELEERLFFPVERTGPPGGHGGRAGPALAATPGPITQGLIPSDSDSEPTRSRCSPDTNSNLVHRYTNCIGCTRAAAAGFRKLESAHVPLFFRVRDESPSLTVTGMRRPPSFCTRRIHRSSHEHSLRSTAGRSPAGRSVRLRKEHGTSPDILFYGLERL